MSVQLMAWAAEQKTGSIARKAVLLSLANAANHHTGRCFPSVARIARETEASERTVRRALDDLEAAGFITRERRRRDDGTLATYEYAFPAVTTTARPADIDDADQRTSATATTGQSDRAEPEVRQREVEREVDTARARDVVVGAANYVPPGVVDRRTVSADEAQIAAVILHAWNERTGQRLRAKEWLAKIIMRIREYPEATYADHVLIIEAALANPWWRGAPTPSVVYGNGAQFERAIQETRAQRHEDDRIARIVEAVQARREAA